MINTDVNSNTQSWELEVVCKNKQYLDEVVGVILKYGMIEFEVDIVEYSPKFDNTFDGRYTVLMWCSWFNNLKNLAEDLDNIEKRLG